MIERGVAVDGLKATWDESSVLRSAVFQVSFWWQCMSSRP